LAGDIATRLTEPGQLTARLDEEGRLVAIDVDNSGGILPIAEPTLTSNELRNLMDAFLSTWISSTGDYIRLFEKSFASYVGMNEGIAASNGTASLHLALLALGIGPGDDVIVPDFTFAATINTVIMTGANPVIVDVAPDSWCLSPDTFSRAITPATRAVIPVHVYGRVCDMPSIASVAQEKGIYVIEDCAEAVGARAGGRSVGSWSDIAAFSFYGNKIITTGEGGMAVTNSPELARRMRILRDHGMQPDRRYWHENVGYNYRMTNLSAAIGLAQFDRIEELLKWRRDLQALYEAKLRNVANITLPSALPDGFESVNWLVCALVPADKRNAMIAACREQRIDLRPFFHSLSAMPAYKRWSRRCPISDELSRSGVNFPTVYRIGERDVDRIVSAINSIDDRS
jgi:perosamine synthetase